jgi:hypothetical protein
MACTGGVAVVLMLALAAPAAAQESEPAPEPVSIEGTLVGAHWPDMAAPACDLPDTTWRFKILVSGQLSGLGEVEAFMTQCTFLEAETYYNRMTMFTTTEGDLLAVVHDLPSTELFVDDDGNYTGYTLEGTWDAVGGTGRFMHAAGTGTVKGAADIPGDIVLDFTGEITLDAPEPPAE